MIAQPFSVPMRFPFSMSDSETNYDINDALKTLPTCNRCRQRRIKCDNDLPACRGCAKAQVQCSFHDHACSEDVPRSYLLSLMNRLQELQSGGQSRHSPRDTAQERHGAFDTRTATGVHVYAVSRSDRHSPGHGDAQWAYWGGLSVFGSLSSAMLSRSIPAPEPAALDLKSQPISDIYRRLPLLTSSAEIFFPNSGVVQQLVEHYYYSVEMLYPVLGRTSLLALPQLAAELDILGQETVAAYVISGSQETGSGHLILVMAISLQLLSKSDSRLASKAASYFAASEGYIAAALKDQNLKSVQLLTLASIYIMLDDTAGNVWQLIGHASRLYCDILDGLDDVHTEDLRMTLLSLEVQLSIAYGRPSEVNSPTCELRKQRPIAANPLAILIADLSGIRLATQERSLKADGSGDLSQGWVVEITMLLDKWHKKWQQMAASASNFELPSLEFMYPLAKEYGVFILHEALLQLYTISQVEQETRLATAAALISSLHILIEKASQPDARGRAIQCIPFLPWPCFHSVLQAITVLLSAGQDIYYKHKQIIRLGLRLCMDSQHDQNNAVYKALQSSCDQYENSKRLDDHVTAIASTTTTTAERPSAS